MSITEQVAIVNNYERPVVAIFDFDGTLTHKDSFLPFLKFAYGRWYWLYLIPYSVFLLGYLLGFVSNHRVKELLLNRFFKGYQDSELQSLATDYAIYQLPQLMNQLAIERLRWHQKQGHKIIIVSANLEIYLKPWIQMIGVNCLLATQLIFANGVFTGKIKGKCCYGKEKLKRSQELLGALNNYYLYVYGDSQGDQEILEIADSPFYRSFSCGKGLFIH